VEEGKIRETPKEADPVFANAYFVLLLGMDAFISSRAFRVGGEGFFTCCDNSTTTGRWKEQPRICSNSSARCKLPTPSRRVAIIADGEVSSPVTGKGIGGRNSAFVLACVENIVGPPGRGAQRGTTERRKQLGGRAVADGETLARAMSVGLDPRDAFQGATRLHFCAAFDDAIVTGPRGITCGFAILCQNRKKNNGARGRYTIKTIKD